MQGSKLRDTAKTITNGRASSRERKLALQQDVCSNFYFYFLSFVISYPFHLLLIIEYNFLIFLG